MESLAKPSSKNSSARLTDPSASAIDELEELWNVKDDPIEKCCFGGGNNRSVHPDQEVLQVLANALELRQSESGEVEACQHK